MAKVYGFTTVEYIQKNKTPSRTTVQAYHPPLPHYRTHRIYQIGPFDSRDESEMTEKILNNLEIKQILKRETEQYADGTNQK